MHLFFIITYFQSLYSLLLFLSASLYKIIYIHRFLGYNRSSTSGMYAAVDKSLPKENKLEATISTKYSMDKKGKLSRLMLFIFFLSLSNIYLVWIYCVQFTLEDESHHGTETYAVVDKSITKKGILYSFIIKGIF